MTRAVDSLEIMGHFTAIGMRTAIPDGAFVVNTCSDNDTRRIGDDSSWSWCNPTNRVLRHVYEDIEAVSVECLWQGTKVFAEGGGSDAETLSGAWRRGKAKRPIGAYAGPGQPLIIDPGVARRRIYLPAFHRLITHGLGVPEIRERVRRAREHDGTVFLRDWDVGRGLDQRGPMSHAWVLAVFLNTGAMPT